MSSKAAKAKYFFDHIDHQNYLKLNQKKLFLCLDFDGTLAAIVRSPAKAKISRRKKELLAKLNSVKNCQLAFISGRALKDVKSKVGIKSAVYAGNHGFEIEGAGIQFEHQKAKRVQKTLKIFASKAKKALAEVSGCLIENKGYTLSVHYRCAARGYEAYISDKVHALAKKLIASKKFTLSTGKKVLELKPHVLWNKGEAVKEIRRQLLKNKRNILAIYVGDDTTDEDAFKAVNQMKGVSIYVGKNVRATSAKYYVYSVSEVTEILRFLVTQLNLN